MKALAWLGILALPGCGGDSAPGTAAPIDLHAHRSPATWDVLESGDGIERRRDPRTGLVFVLVPAGTFTMGGASDLDRPRHPVRISEPFWLARTEVPVAAWRTWVRRDGGPAELLPGPDADDALPVGGVSARDALGFCDAYGYVLPSEAQWEYACRAGDEAVGVDRATLLREAWVYPNADGRAHPVGTRAANAFGLHDMLGNLWEWCADGVAAPYPVQDPQQVRVDPVVPAGAGARIVRGGSWFSVPVPWPSDRMYGEVDLRTPLFGFRVARPVGDD